MKTLLCTALLATTMVAAAQQPTHQPTPQHPAAETITASGDTYYRALALLETGCRDHVTGANEEVSRYQMLPRVWAAATKLPLTAASNPFTALNVAKIVMAKRVKAFTNKTGRQPTPEEWSLLWHCPSHTGRPNKEEMEYAERFCNLISKRD